MKLSVKKVEDRIGILRANWEGACYAIAKKILDSGLVKGKLRYGHYYGYVHQDSLFFSSSIVRHGWIEMKDGTVIDATRWCFECKKPYIYIGKSSDEYDAGGQKWRQATRTLPPEFDESKEVKLKVSVEVREFILCLLNYPYITSKGLFWIANLPLDALDKHAKEIYIGLDILNMGAFVPIDNYRLVMEE